VRILITALFLAVASCLPAIGEILEYHHCEAGILPSQQGWRFTESGDEAQVCRIQDGILQFDTMGQPDFSPLGLANYRRPFRIQDSVAETITVQLRARVLELEASGDWRTGFALVVDWTNPNGYGHHFGFAIAPSHIFRWFNGRSIADLDATQWHDYTMVCDLIYGLMTVLVDGETIGTYEVDPAQGYRMVYLGDMMHTSNAFAEIEDLEFTVEGSPNVAVEARSWSGVKSLFGP